MGPLAFASHFLYKFCASLLAVQCFCTVSCNIVGFSADLPS
jgi:hypothetical protein